MLLENTKSHEEISSPFIIEKIDNINIPKVEVKEENNERNLEINGSVAFENVRIYSGDKLRFQENNPNILQIRHLRKDDHNVTSVIDINDPKKELLTISNERVKTFGGEKEQMLINGKKWDSLDYLNIYWDGYRVEVDPEGKKIVFCGHEGEDYKSSAKWEVVVNNQKWNTKFDDHINIASSVGGTVYALGGPHNANKLAINDKEWMYKKYKSDRFSPDEIKDVGVSPDGAVVALVDSGRDKEDYRRYISIGDKVGEKYVWKNNFYTTSHDKKNVIAFDNNDKHIAIYGETEKSGAKGLIIDDIPYALETNPQKIEYMKFQDGGLVIQYEDSLGEKITEKITLKEDSEQIQERKEKIEEEEKAIVELRRLLIEKDIPASEIAIRLKMAGELESVVAKNKELNEKVSKYLESSTSWEKKYNELEKADKNKETQIEIKEKELKKIKTIMLEIDEILKGAGKVTFGSSSTISSKNMKIVLDLINTSKSS